MPNLDVIVAGITGLISGVVGSLVAPWVTWRIERVRQQAAHRRQQVARWREAVDSFDFAEKRFGDTVIYSELRPYLDENFRKTFESGTTFEVPSRGRGHNAARHTILDAITEIERKWRLV